MSDNVRQENATQRMELGPCILCGETVYALDPARGNGEGPYLHQGCGW